ncbi:MAG: PilZ domain-containing protein [Thermoanaerobaculia bacterium]|nr:PilZ domain-containing protein [Thermoanaerobaculia bacterium]
MSEEERHDPSREERRSHHRFPVEGLSGVLALSLEAEVLDLSLAGMAVEVPVPLTVGKRFAVRIGAGEDQLDLIGTVRWSERSDVEGATSREAQEVQPRYRAGFAFHDILTERAAGLMEFMERNVVLALDRQLFGRLELDGETRANLEGDFELRLIRLGLESAVGETPHPPETGRPCELELNLRGRQFVTPGRVESVRADDGDGPGYRVEIEFEETPEDQEETLRSFIRSRIS